MFNDPKVDETITIQGKTYRFIQVPETPGIVYAELGKKAKVYRVLHGDKAYAWKVFKPAYRTPRLTKNTHQISKYQTIPGLTVAERITLVPEKFQDVVSRYPEFSYSILMPWIEGQSWANYIASQRAISKNDSVNLANALAHTISKLEEQNLAHCDLSGGNFIFSNDFNHVELVDIEELYGNDLQRPDPIPAGTSGYSPDWVKKSGLWSPDADRFAGGILICEILGWQFQDIRTAASKGDAYFSESELCQDSKRYRLLVKRLEELHPDLAGLFQAVWKAGRASECPPISRWKKVLNQMAGNAAVSSWGWESLDLQIDIDTSDLALDESEISPRISHEIQPENTLQAGAETIMTDRSTSEPADKNTNPDQEKQVDGTEPIAQPWPAIGKSRKDLLIRIFFIFVLVGIILSLIILASGDLIEEVASSFREQSGWILVEMVGNSILGLLVGCVHAWIFKNNIRKSYVGLFILSAFVGGAIGGATTGFLTDLGYIKSAYTAGALIGSIGGTLSSLGQNLFMRSQGMQIKWFLFSLISWFVVWIVGTNISWNNQNVLGTASSAATIIIASGAALSFFLHQYPEIEF